MKISITLRQTYGSPRAYPVDKTTEAFTRLTGTKTLTMEHLRIIRAMGVRIDVVDWDHLSSDWAKTIERWKQ